MPVTKQLFLENHIVLTNIYPDLECYYRIEAWHIEIQDIINNLVSIKIFFVNDTNNNNNQTNNNSQTANNIGVGTSFINENTNIESVGLYDGDGAYRSIRSILNILIPPLKYSPTFSFFNNILKIKLSGDGHLVGKKQNQVILTFCLLNEGENVLKPDHQHR